VTDLAGAKRFGTLRCYGRFFHAMLDRGFYFAPSQFEAAFLSAGPTRRPRSTVRVAAADDALRGPFDRLR